jgi:hypothetical protein
MGAESPLEELLERLEVDYGGTDIGWKVLHYTAQLRSARIDGNIDKAVLAGMAMVFDMVKDPAFTGFAVRQAARRGGRKPGANAQRNMEMAVEFLKARERSKASASAIMASIGKSRNLSRSQAINCIRSALKKVSD